MLIFISAARPLFASTDISTEKEYKNGYSLNSWKISMSKGNIISSSGLRNRENFGFVFSPGLYDIRTVSGNCWGIQGKIKNTDNRNAPRFIK